MSCLQIKRKNCILVFEEPFYNMSKLTGNLRGHGYWGGEVEDSPKAPCQVMTRVSIREVSRVPAETAALAELKKHPPWESAFSPARCR